MRVIGGSWSDEAIAAASAAQADGAGVAALLVAALDAERKRRKTQVAWTLEDFASFFPKPTPPTAAPEPEPASRAG